MISLRSDLRDPTPAPNPADLNCLPGGVNSVIGIPSSFDLVIGVSSLPIELSAAAGTPVWMLGFSPETYYRRKNGGRTDCDVVTVNSTIIGPSQPRVAFARDDRVALHETIVRVQSRLETMVRSSWYRKDSLCTSITNGSLVPTPCKTSVGLSHPQAKVRGLWANSEVR